MVVELTKNYARFRQRDPSLFVRGSLRTKDIGRVGHSKIIIGRLRSSGKFAVQSVLVDRKDYEDGVRVVLQHGQPRIVRSL